MLARIARLVAYCAFMTPVFSGALLAQSKPLLVFAAASLKPGLDALVAGGCCGAVDISYAGSGVLARQIVHGAPADVVILADPMWLEPLRDGGYLRAAPRVIAGNHVVLAGRVGAQISTAKRIAMGDPTFVPAGRYARQALEARGLWADVVPRVVYADSVRGALVFLTRGEVELAAVYASDLVGVQGLEVIAELPLPIDVPPIAYPAVAVSTHPDADAFIEVLAGPIGQSALGAAGFAAPPPAS